MRNIAHTLTAWRAHKFRFVWALDSLAEAKRQGMRYLREGGGRTVHVTRRNRVIWSRGVTKK